IHLLRCAARFFRTRAIDPKHVAFSREKFLAAADRTLGNRRTRDLLIEREPETPFDLPFDPLEKTANARTVRVYVLHDTIVGREQGEQMHGEQRWHRQEQL